MPIACGRVKTSNFASRSRSPSPTSPLGANTAVLNKLAPATAWRNRPLVCPGSRSSAVWDVHASFLPRFRTQRAHHRRRPFPAWRLLHLHLPLPLPLPLHLRTVFGESGVYRLHVHAHATRPHFGGNAGCRWSQTTQTTHTTNYMLRRYRLSSLPHPLAPRLASSPFVLRFSFTISCHFHG